MEFTQLFSILSVLGALLFFSAGFSLALLKGGRAPASTETESEQDSARETALREAMGRSAALDAECLRLRSKVGAASAEIARLTATLADLERRHAVAPSALPPLDATTGAMTFQGILGRLSKTKGMRAAVLGDALGLPVAAFGEQSESLAGYCGFISQAASKAGEFLQLGSIRRIVIEDERLATLTACSIGGTDLFLATLTSGPGPDFARMVQVLNDVKSFISQRSRA
jgi:predicted regulator of Ras-like GTPase activity (Roadblock/LC7/MglB family)